MAFRIGMLWWIHGTLVLGDWSQKNGGLPVGRGLSWMLNFAKDARYGARQFRRAPGYAVFTWLVLALGIGTVTAMFTISYGVLLRPLPFAADRQLFGPLE